MSCFSFYFLKTGNDEQNQTTFLIKQVVKRGKMSGVSEISKCF